MSHRNALAGLVLAKALAGRRDEPDQPEPEKPARRQERWARLRGLVPRRARPCDDGACVFLAEHYLPAVSAERVEALTRRLEAAAATVRREGTDVRFLGFAALPDDESFLFLLAAPCSEAAARAVEFAEVAPDRIVPAIWRAGNAA